MFNRRLNGRTLSGHCAPFVRTKGAQGRKRGTGDREYLKNAKKPGVIAVFLVQSATSDSLALSDL